MNLLAQQVEVICRLRAEPKGGPAVVRQDGEARKEEILSCVAKHGPIGETAIASRTGLMRTCVHNHLKDLEALRKIKRASDKNRAPWVIANPIPARLVTFETEEDSE